MTDHLRRRNDAHLSTDLRRLARCHAIDEARRKLIARTGRIDRRCHAKYGAAWEEYCQRVPWRLLPGIW